MGLFGTLLSFGVGYAAGMKLGDRPVRAVRSASEQARSGASGLAAAASSLRPGAGGTMDVRTIREVMTETPEGVTPDTSLAQAASVMQRSDIGDVLVVDAGGQLRGILTDRDIVIRALAEGRDASTTVGDVMTPTVATIDPTSTVQEALDLMRRHDVRRLPVVEGGRPIGIVSLGDVSMSTRARGALADISTAPPNN